MDEREPDSIDAMRRSEAALLLAGWLPPHDREIAKLRAAGVRDTDLPPSGRRLIATDDDAPTMRPSLATARARAKQLSLPPHDSPVVSERRLTLLPPPTLLDNEPSELEVASDSPESESPPAPVLGGAQAVLPIPGATGQRAVPPSSLRGFATLSEAERAEMASRGGKAAHRAGTAHTFSSGEARAASRKAATHRQLRRKAGKARSGQTTLRSR